MTNDNEELPVDFPRHSKRKAELTIAKPGEKIPTEVKTIVLDLLRDAHYTKGEIASTCGVSRSTIDRWLEKDPQLKAAYQSAWMERMQKVEQAMVDRAIEGRNEIAAQQAGEFLLKHNIREIYDDKAVSQDRLANLPKIVVPLTVNVRTQGKVSQAIQEAEMIDV